MNLHACLSPPDHDYLATTRLPFRANDGTCLATALDQSVPARPLHNRTCLASPRLPYMTMT